MSRRTKPRHGVSIKDDLLDALSAIKTSGSFAYSTAIADPPPCDISVPGIGNIRMPLEESQARELVALARQAPYGKGAETIVDTSVRNTWELDSSQFVCQSPHWNQWLQGVCEDFVVPKLGISPERCIGAVPYKMLIYEKGAMFKAHTE